MNQEFDLAAMTHTDCGLPNIPREDEIIKLKWLWFNFVLPMKKYIGEITITSAFRSDAVNKHVGGVPTSQHRLAEAIDFIPKEVKFEDAFSWCKSSLEFGQLIIERSGDKRWIHISRPRVGKPNMQALRMENGKYFLA